MAAVSRRAASEQHNAGSSLGRRVQFLDEPAGPVEAIIDRLLEGHSGAVGIAALFQQESDGPQDLGNRPVVGLDGSVVQRQEAVHVAVVLKLDDRAVQCLRSMPLTAAAEQMQA